MASSALRFKWFVERDCALSFEYADGAPDDWSRERGATHTLMLNTPLACGWDRRAAIVKKTVAYVAVDEGADGSIVWEKWRVRHPL